MKKSLELQLFTDAAELADRLAHVYAVRSSELMFSRYPANALRLSRLRVQSLRRYNRRLAALIESAKGGTNV